MVVARKSWQLSHNRPEQAESFLYGEIKFSEHRGYVLFLSVTLHKGTGAILCNSGK